MKRQHSRSRRAGRRSLLGAWRDELGLVKPVTKRTSWRVAMAAVALVLLIAYIAV
jgi:hypothetical protein